MNFFKKLFVLPILLVAVSCSKDLDLQPEDGVSPDQISESNIGLFMTGLYRTSVPDRDVYVLDDIRGQNYTWTALSGSSSSYGVMTTGIGVDDRLGFSSTIWDRNYKTIFNANNILQAAETIGADKAAVAVIVGEASYIRAWAYFNLVKNFGDVPLILSTQAENIPRTPMAEVYGLIMSDLDKAIAYTKDLSATGNTVVSTEAARALKSRVLLYQGAKQEAAQLAKEVIAGSGKELDADYGTIFQEVNSSKEVIFAFANLKNENNVRMSSLYWPYGTTWAGSYFVQPTDYVINELYSPGDIRKDVNIQKIINADGSYNYIVSKYWDVQPLIISRLAELYLICAEGLDAAEGLTYLNQLRKIRGTRELTMGEFDTEAKRKDAILMERRRELFSEGFLYEDLVRTKEAMKLSNTPSPERIYLPIPGAQINLSNGVLEQNQGY